MSLDQFGIADPNFSLPDPVGSVDGEPIPRAELIRVAAGLASANGRDVATFTNAEKKKLYKSVLDEMIVDKLVSKAAADEKVSELDVEKRFDSLKGQYPSPQAFEAEVKKSGQSMDQIKENIRMQLKQQQWIEKKVSGMDKVTAEEVDKFYKDNPGKFDAPEMVKASHILLAVSRDAAPETVLEKEKAINVLAARIKKGESFEELAKANSDDPDTRKDGGNLDYFSRDRIMPEFADAAFKLKIGEVSAPVRTQFGFHLIKLTDHKDARTVPLDEAREQIASYLQQSRRREEVDKVVASLRDNAKVEVNIP